MRFPGLEILKNKDGIRYFKNIKYPDIPISENDIYIITEAAERLDLLAYQYYKSVDDYWIISLANEIPYDSIYVPIGIQLRIPQDIAEAKRLFDKLNNIT